MDSGPGTTPDQAWRSPPLMLQVTRAEAALTSLARATDRIQRIEVEEASAFAEYHAAVQECRAQGLAVDYEMTPGMAASYSVFKQELARQEGRRVAQDEA